MGHSSLFLEHIQKNDGSTSYHQTQSYQAPSSYKETHCSPPPSCHQTPPRDQEKTPPLQEESCPTTTQGPPRIQPRKPNSGLERNQGKGEDNRPRKKTLDEKQERKDCFEEG